MKAYAIAIYDKATEDNKVEILEGEDLRDALLRHSRVDPNMWAPPATDQDVKSRFWAHGIDAVEIPALRVAKVNLPDCKEVIIGPETRKGSIT